MCRDDARCGGRRESPLTSAILHCTAGVIGTVAVAVAVATTAVASRAVAVTVCCTWSPGATTLVGVTTFVTLMCGVTGGVAGNPILWISPDELVT